MAMELLSVLPTIFQYHQTNFWQCMECIVPVVQYIESQIERSTSVDIISDGDLTSMLSGSGGSQVDVVFYLILHSNSNAWKLSLSYILMPHRNEACGPRVSTPPLSLDKYYSTHRSVRRSVGRSNPVPQSEYSEPTSGSKYKTVSVWNSS